MILHKINSVLTYAITYEFQKFYDVINEILEYNKENNINPDDYKTIKISLFDFYDYKSDDIVLLEKEFFKRVSKNKLKVQHV